MTKQNQISKSVLVFSTLESFLESFAKVKRECNPRWTLGSWAKAVGLPNTAALTRIMTGERTPGERFVKRMIDYLSLSGLEKEYFLFLVLKMKAKTDPVLQAVLKERCWPTLSTTSTSEFVPTKVNDPLLKITDGEMISLIGSASFSETSLLLKTEKLEPVPTNGKAMVVLCFCDYKASNVGPYCEGYLSIFSKPMGEELSEIGFLFRHIVTNSTTLANLGRIIWSNDYSEAEFESSLPNKKPLNYRVSCRSKPYLELKLGLPFYIGTDHPEEIQLNGFADIYGSRKRYTLKIKSHLFERAFDPQNDSFIVDGPTKLNTTLQTINFQPVSWQYRNQLSCMVSSPLNVLD